jgi:hypothetical protein
MSLRLEGGEDLLRIDADDGPVATYHVGARWARPFYLPVCGPGGVPVTRGWPVDPAPGETEDHPHHKGVWVAHGDVNGVDNWGEGEGHGRTDHLGFDALEVSGGTIRIEERTSWQDAAGVSLLRERRSMAWSVEGADRVLDLDLVFEPESGDVVFGDTKEGGLLSVRVATSMDAAHQGRIENAEGLVYERGEGPETTWGRRAAWVDYSGPVGSERFGIAILDHPGNPVHPTYWHVRGYGLFTANPFGVSSFAPDAGTRGDLLLKAGSDLRFRYRMIVHRGDAAAASVAARWEAFTGR